METSQIIFLPYKYFPPFNVIEDLKSFQFFYRKYYQDIERDSKNKYELMLRKQQMADMIRSKIKLVE